MDSPNTVANFPVDDWVMVETHPTQHPASPTSIVDAPMMVVSNTHEEKYDGCFKIESFFQLYEMRLWYKMDAVRVYYVWKDTQQNKLYLFLLDKDRALIPPIVPQSLLPCFENQRLVGRVFSLRFFQVERSDPDDFPMFEHYTLQHTHNYVILINKQTQLNHITNGHFDYFPKYPIMPHISCLLEDKTSRRMMTDVIGKITKGYPQPNGSFCLFLRDWSCGSEVRLILLHNETKHTPMIINGIKDNGIIYASRLKVIHHATGNYLESTPLTVIESYPDMDETTYISRLPVPKLPHGDFILEFMGLKTGEFDPDMLGAEFLERLHI